MYPWSRKSLITVPKVLADVPLATGITYNVATDVLRIMIIFEHQIK